MEVHELNFICFYLVSSCALQHWYSWVIYIVYDDPAIFIALNYDYFLDCPIIVFVRFSLRWFNFKFGSGCSTKCARPYYLTPDVSDTNTSRPAGRLTAVTNYYLFVMFDTQIQFIQCIISSPGCKCHFANKLYIILYIHVYCMALHASTHFMCWTTKPSYKYKFILRVREGIHRYANHAENCKIILNRIKNNSDSKDSSTCNNKKYKPIAKLINEDSGLWENIRERITLEMFR
jgi:hypothetical protein